MVRVLPSGAPDYTSQINAREAAANDALARLFYTLMARREESMRMEQLRRDLQMQQQGFTAEQNQLNRDWRTDLEYNKPGQQQQPSYLAPRSGGRTMAPATAAAPAPASKLAPAAPSGGGFKQGPVGPNPNRFSNIDNPVELAGSYPSPFEPDVSAGETVTLSGQAVRPEKLPPTRQGQAPTGTTPQPRQSRRPRLTAQGVWGPIDDQYTQAWDAAEKKYNLPKGLLQTMVGVQHNFGRDDGGDDGWYRMSPDLKQVWQVTPEDSKDLVKMTDVAGKNMARNREAYNRYVDQYNKANKTNIPKLGNSAAEVPVYAILNQFGVTNGPRVIVAAHVNENAPIAPQMAPEKGVDPSRQLLTMGLPADATGKYLFGNNNGVGKRAADTHATTVQHQENPPSADDADAPIPRSDVPQADPYAYLQSRGASADVRSLRPDFAARIAASMQDAEAATGQRGSINNAYRSPEEQAQIRANARGVPVTYRGTRYLPKPGPRGYPAAGPGQSEHGAGTAIDLNRGAVRDYMRRPEQLKKHNLSTIRRDEPHIQDATVRGSASSRQVGREDRSGGTVDTAAAPAPATTAAAAPTDELTRTPMFNQKPITQPKTAQVNTFGTVASPPLATMQPGLKGALAGATVAPKLQVAEESPVQLPTTAPTPTAVPKTASVPSETSAAANQPTPQTAQTVEQKTQAPPVANTEYGYTDDPNERASDVISKPYDAPPALEPAQPSKVLNTITGAASGVHGAIKDIGWAADDIVKQAGKGLGDLIGDVTAPLVKAATPDPRYTDPRYVESTQGFDEAGMTGVDQYVSPEAVPGAGTRALLGGANSIIQSIQDRAKAYNTLQAGRNESRQLEQVYNYPSAEQPRTPTPEPTTNWLDPIQARTAEEGIIAARVAATTAPARTPPPQQPQVPDIPYDPTELGRQQMQAAEANVQMPPQERESVPSTLSPRADSLAFDPNTEGVPSYAIPPEVQQLMRQAQPTPTTPPLPVEASKVAEAMYDVNTEGVPSYGLPAQGLGIPAMTMPDTVSLWDLIKSRGMGRKDETRATAAPSPKQMPPPIKAPIREVLPSGEVLYPDQPPQVVPPKRAPAKELQTPTVPGVTPSGPKTMPSGVPSRSKYDPNAPKKYDFDPNTKKAIIPKQQEEEPIEQIAPDDEEQ